MAAQTVGKSKRWVRADGQWRRYGRRWTAIRAAVLVRDDYTCGYCGKSPRETSGLVLEVDHIIPFTAGGEEYDLGNCVVSCYGCNRTYNGGRKPAHIERAMLQYAARQNAAMGQID